MALVYVCCDTPENIQAHQREARRKLDKCLPKSISEKKGVVSVLTAGLVRRLKGFRRQFCDASSRNAMMHQQRKSWGSATVRDGVG